MSRNRRNSSDSRAILDQSAAMMPIVVRLYMGLRVGYAT